MPFGRLPLLNEAAPAKGRLSIRFARTAAGALVGLAVVNVLVMAFISFSPGNRVDSVLGNVRRPGLLVAGTEGYCVTRLNSMGLRAAEPEIVRKSPERLLFLGDSLTEAYQVMDEETFVARVQRSLVERGSRVACVNAGVSGASPADYLYLAPTLERAYAPTRVIVQVGDTDFGPSLTSTEATRWLEPRGSTWAIGRAEVPPVAAWLRGIGPLLPAPYYIYQRMLKNAVLKGSAEPQTGPTLVVADPTMVEWVVRQLRDVYGANTVVLYLPQIDYFGQTVASTATETLVRRTCGRVGVGFVDVREAISKHYAQSRQPLNGFANTVPGIGHLNADGHAVVAAELIRYLTSAPGSPFGETWDGD